MYNCYHRYDVTVVDGFLGLGDLEDQYLNLFARMIKKRVEIYC